MKKSLLFVISLLMVGLVLLGACAQPAPAPAPAPKPAPKPAPAPQVIKLKHASIISATSPPALVDLWFFDELNKRVAPDRVEVEYHWGGALGGRPEMMDLLTSGTIDFGTTSPGVFPDQFPLGHLMGAIAIDGIGDWETFALIDDYWQLETKLVVDEATAVGIKVVRVGATMPFNVLTSQKVASLADLKNVKMRVMTADLVPLWEAMGMVPVSVSFGEVYEALQRGTLEATPIDYMYSQTYKMNEVAKYMYEMQLPVHMLYLIANLNSYNRLPPHIRAVVDDLTVEAREWSVNMLREKEVEAKNFLAAQGVTFISPTPEEVTQMKSSIPAAKAYAIKLGVEKGARADDIEAVWASAGKVAQRLMGK